MTLLRKGGPSSSRVEVIAQGPIPSGLEVSFYDDLVFPKSKKMRPLDRSPGPSTPIGGSARPSAPRMPRTTDLEHME